MQIRLNRIQRSPSFLIVVVLVVVVYIEYEYEYEWEGMRVGGDDA